MEHIATANPYFGVFVLFVITFGAFTATTMAARWASRALQLKIVRKLNYQFMSVDQKLQDNQIEYHHSFIYLHYYFYYLM